MYPIGQAVTVGNSEIDATITVSDLRKVTGTYEGHTDISTRDFYAVTVTMSSTRGTMHINPYDLDLYTVDGTKGDHMVETDAQDELDDSDVPARETVKGSLSVGVPKGQPIQRITYSPGSSIVATWKPGPGPIPTSTAVETQPYEPAQPPETTEAPDPETQDPVAYGQHCTDDGEIVGNLRCTYVGGGNQMWTYFAPGATEGN